jgi:hypothetical protein
MCEVEKVVRDIDYGHLLRRDICDQLNRAPRAHLR